MTKKLFVLFIATLWTLTFAEDEWSIHTEMGDDGSMSSSSSEPKSTSQQKSSWDDYSSNNQSSTSGNSANIMELSKEQFSIKIINCSRNMEGTVICTLTITNNDEWDRLFKIQYGGPDTEIYDDQGNDYDIRTIYLGNSKKTFSTVGSDYQIVQKKLIAGLPVKTVLTFEKVTRKANKIALLQINGGSSTRLFRFRNIPLN